MSNVYEIVTQQVIEQLEQGVAPWRKPWSSALPCNLLSQKPYRGMNVFFLATQGFESKYWLTFNQCAKLGDDFTAEALQGRQRLLSSYTLETHRAGKVCWPQCLDLLL